MMLPRVRSAWQTGTHVAIVGLAFLFVLVHSASATIEFDERLQLSGQVESINLMRTPGLHEAEFIQQRNSLYLRIDWDWLRDGKFIDKYDLPFIQNSHFYFLYRGVYDSFYDIAPGGTQTGQSRQDDLIGGPVIGNIPGGCRRDIGNPTGDCSLPGARLKDGLYSRMDSGTRSALKYENRLREIYADITLRDIPLTLRIGRQQVIWGETDMFRLMDVWNPLDVSWRFPIADTHDHFRTPLWMIKGVYDLGMIGNFSNNFVEVVWNPFDFQPGQKVGWLPRPWSLPFADPLREGQVQNASIGPVNLLVSPHFDMQGTSFHRGDFHRNPQDASEAGIRLHTITPQGIETTLTYVYGRGKWMANTPAFNVKISGVQNDLTSSVGTWAGTNVVKSTVIGQVVHPYVHVVGWSLNYFEPDYTQAVWRMETAYTQGQPYATSEPDKLLDVGFGQKAPVGFIKRDVIAGMVAFDRPTWIRFLNPRATWVVSSQLFWVYIPGDNVKQLRGFASSNDDPYFTPAASDPLIGHLASTGGFGQWQTGPFAGLNERVQASNLPPGDHYQHWEFMHTLALTTFYRGGTISPQFVTLFDPVNLWMMEAFELKYFYTNNLYFTFQQRAVIPFHPPTQDPWFVGRFGRRPEVGLIVTYQF